jgi:hypothetical protein
MWDEHGNRLDERASIAPPKQRAMNERARRERERAAPPREPERRTLLGVVMDNGLYAIPIGIAVLLVRIWMRS